MLSGIPRRRPISTFSRLCLLLLRLLPTPMQLGGIPISSLTPQNTALSLDLVPQVKPLLVAQLLQQQLKTTTMSTSSVKMMKKTPKPSV